MDLLPLATVLVFLLFAALASGIWVGFALAALGFVAIYSTISISPGDILATSVWSASNSWDLTALPMFIWMGEILHRTKLSDDMFEGLAPLMQKLPGRLCM
jgi:C4-dicarboxylate transporter, DctM subunit